MNFRRTAATLLLALTTAVPAFAETQNEVLLIRPLEPTGYKLNNDIHIGAAILGAWIPLIANKARNSSNSNDFTTAIVRMKPRYAELFYDELNKTLIEQGVKTVEFIGARPNPSKPDNPTFASTNPEDKVLIYPIFYSVGLRSNHNMSYYQPAIHLGGCVITKKYRKDCTTTFWGMYGDNYDEEDETVMFADVSERWMNPDDAMKNIGDVEKALHRGIAGAAMKVGKQVAEYLKEEKLIATGAITVTEISQPGKEN